MATIRKRGHSWQVQVRREGYPPISKSFQSKAEAASWGREQEHGIERGASPVHSRSIRGVKLGDLLCRYEEQVTAHKRGFDPRGLASRFSQDTLTLTQQTGPR